MSAGQSFRIGGIDFNAIRWPKPRIDWAMLWTQSRKGNHHASDRGAAQDLYSVEFTLYEKASVLNALQSTLEANRYQVAMTNFGEAIFAPNLDHTGTINAVIQTRGPRAAKSYAAGNSEMFEMKCKAIAIQPPKLTITPSLAVLRLQHGYEADKSFEARTGLAYDQTAYFTDTQDDAGTFNFKGLQFVDELQAVLSFILAGSSRGVAFTLPTIAGEAYPFGVSKGAGPFQAKIREFSFSRRDFQMWDLSIRFVEHA